MAKIRVITKQLGLQKLVNVAAYTRVSSDKDAMLHSLSNQVSYFSSYIQSNKNWIYCGVYSDEAQTGTKSKRSAFQRMIQDAKDGKIDIIITKSISRFARNTETLLKTIRELKEINVDVYFQEQNIHTLSNDGELLMSILASYAQEESRVSSENSLWRVKKNFNEGKIYGGKNCLGYKIVDGQFEVVPDEAELVKHIFNLCEQGYGDDKIAKTLNDMGVKSYFGNLWYRSSVRGVLTNYNYTGDLILQKTYRENHLTKTTKINYGEMDMFHVANNHEPIISKEQFQNVKRIRAERLPRNHRVAFTLHSFTGFLKCGVCGRSYKHKKNKYLEYWVCSTYEQLGKSYCDSKQIRDDVLKKATCQVLNLEEFDTQKLDQFIAQIEILNGNKLIFNMHNGEKREVNWDVPKRSDSWTDEMKEKARLDALKRKTVAGGSE